MYQICTSKAKFDVSWQKLEFRIKVGSELGKSLSFGGKVGSELEKLCISKEKVDLSELQRFDSVKKNWI